jgi:serine/threonine protein kinase
VAAACLLYDKNITHRDIKAQNILIKGQTAKLADFGFAKELREKDNQ